MILPILQRCISLFLVISAIFIVISCDSEVRHESLKTGDLLFCGTGSDGLSKAIDAVTTTGGNNYSHVGILVKSEGSFTVLHAYPEKGVCEETLDSFVTQRKRQDIIIDVYRISELPAESLENAVINSRKVIGEPYNFTYRLHDSGYYCSELVYEAFSYDSIFELNDMTFKDSAGNIPQAWIDHYEDLGVTIPEGLPGCNPNGMAASEKLQFITQLLP